VSTLEDRTRPNLSSSPATLDLHEIQASVLRYPPEPYYGTHVLLHIDDAPSACEFLRRLAPHVASAAGWWKATDAWIAVAISYTGLVTLGVPEKSLHSFPEAFRVGMAARADILLDHGKTPINREPYDEPTMQPNSPFAATVRANGPRARGVLRTSTLPCPDRPSQRAVVVDEWP
jgi:deferrochelatase/peroxidase EfeB